MDKKQRIIGLLLMTVWAITGSAHYYNNVRVYDTPIRCLAQDESSLIWLGTGNGLYCYDGYRSVPRFSLAEIMHKTIYCMLSSGHHLYVGTSEGFFVYDTKLNTCHQPKQMQTEVRALVMRDHKILVGKPEGVWEYDTQTDQLYSLDSSISNIYALEIVSDKVFIGTLQGLFLIEGRSVKEISLRPNEHPFINSLLADEQRHCLWIGAGDMLYKYDLLTGHVAESKEMTGVSVKAMSLAKDGTMYIATDNGFYTYADGMFSLDKHDARNPHTLADNVVWSACIDIKGNIILGTDVGLSVVNALSYYSYQPVSQLTGQSDGNKMSSLFVDSKGRKWYGGTNGLILKEGTDTRWYRQVDKEYPISHNRIRCVYEDLTGNIWIATDNGINLYDEKSCRMHNIVITDQTGENTARWAYDIIDDGQGNLWVAAFSGGIFIVDKEKLLKTQGFIVADKHIDQREDGLSDLWVRQMKKDSKGNVWVSTGKGLDCVGIISKKVTNILDTIPGLIASDVDGNIWVANPKLLLCYTDIETSKHFSYGVKQSDIEAVSLCNVNGQIWVVTADECILIGRNDNRRLRIPVIDAYGAYFAKEDKCLYIGGQDGLITIYPSEIGTASQRRRLLLSDFLVNGEQRQVSDNNIKLSYNENTIELFLSDLPYMGEVSVSYAYQLEGVDEVWHLLPSLSEPLVYNALPPGDYTLRIKTIDSSYGDEDEVFIAKIGILPPWYFSLWAKILYVLILQGLILWGIRFYMVRKNLQREKREKQHIIEQSKARMDFYNNMSRSLSQALHNVMAPLSEMIAKGGNAETNKSLSSVRTQTTKINSLIRQAFDVGNIIQRDQNLTLSRINVVEFCKETLDGIKPQLEEKNVNVRFETTNMAIFMDTEVIRFDSILSILIQNILRHANYNSLLTLSMTSDLLQKNVRIALSGSSMNVPESQLPYLFQRFAQSKDGLNLGEIGNNLYLVKEYVEELGGKIRVETSGFIGTTFAMTFDVLDMVAPQQSLGQAHEAEPSEPVSMTTAEQEEVISEKDEKLMREITIAIEDNMIDSDFNVTRLQETVGIGQKLLYRKIKQIAGVTPVEYIRNIRMEKAARLLREGKFSISEVMYMVGFTKSGYFSKCFQEAFGMMPSAYIKKANNQ